MKILVVEDESTVAKTIEMILLSQHYAVDLAAHGLAGLEMIEAYSYDLIVLDIGLPQIDGVSLCQKLRDRGIQTPILLLTGQDATAQAKAIALNTGADDYMTKPFDAEELVARIQTLLRRGDLKTLPVLQWGALSLDPSRLQVSYGETLLHLTPKEYSLLEILLRHAPNILNTYTILEQGWNALEVPSDETLRTHMKGLRKKLRLAGAANDFIKTVHRQGYRLNPLYGEVAPTAQEKTPTLLQMAEIKAVNEELRTALEQLQATQAELQIKNQELQMVRDELEQRVAERTVELRQQETFLRSIYEGTAQAIFVVAITETGDFHYVSLNAAAQRLTGLSQEAFQGKTPEAVFGPETGALFRQNYRECVQAQQSIFYEDYFVFRGSPVWTLTTLSPIRNAQGQIDQLVGTVLDIGDRKAIEAALQASESKYRALFNEIDEGYCIAEIILDDAGNPVDYRILEANPQFEQLTDLSLEIALSGQTIREIAPELEEHWYQIYGNVALTGKPIRFEQQAAGWGRWYNVYAFRIGAPEKRQVAILFSDINHQKNAETALRQSEEKLRLFVAASSDIIYRMSADWQEMRCLEGKEFLVSTDIPRRNWLNIYIPTEEQSRVMAAVQGAIDTKRFFELEHQVIRRDGTIGWTFSRAIPILDDQENIIEWFGAASDVTDRKNAELDLKRQIRQEYLLADIAREIRQSLDLEQVLRSTVVRVREWLECDRVVIFQFAPDWQGNVIMESVSDQFNALQSATIVDSCLTENFLEPYCQGHISVLNDVNQSDLDPCYVELLKQFQVQASLAVPILQGQGLWGLLIAHQCAAPRHWQDNEIVTLRRLGTQVAIAIHQAELYERIRQELTHRAQIQTVLQESEARLQAIVDNAPVVIYLLNPENRHLLVNRSYADLLEVTPDSLIGKNVYEVWPEAIADIFVSQNHSVLETGRLLQTEDVISLSDGSHTYITIKFPLYDASGVPYAVCGISTDITQKKLLEAQFYQAQRLESLGTLASGIAHDLNNVLTPILGMTQIFRLTQPDLDTTGLEQLQFIEASAKRGANLVKQVLSVTRTTQGEPTTVNLAALLQEEIEMIRQSFPKSIEIQVNFSSTTNAQADLGQILADPIFLHQIILNLCINARDAMPAGGLITISGEKVFVDKTKAAKKLDAHIGHYAVISITDTGSGIPPEIQKRMFDPFFTTKGPGLGTGLGLTTVNSLVKSNQGFLEVFSKVGQGTQFKIYFPLIEDGRLTDEKSSKLTQALKANNYGELILVVEDEALLRGMLQSLLETQHYQVLLAENGAQALELYQQHQETIKLVMTDLMMSPIDGFVLTEHLRAAGASIPIMALSGVPTHEQKAIATGADCFMTKPFDINILLSQVAALLENI
ncbi:response regulator [Picosynechococcus sp. NKBG15041c]|uniref:response regulator n=1 Tax=Picosynechococcus sp. NKBG15041c TaxID=1407650 RepID=UPI00040C452D|nr:response regulator [Picosynechococcus sp. NKBG15041c]